MEFKKKILQLQKSYFLLGTGMLNSQNIQKHPTERWITVTDSSKLELVAIYNIQKDQFLILKQNLNDPGKDQFKMRTPAKGIDYFERH